MTIHSPQPLARALILRAIICLAVGLVISIAAAWSLGNRSHLWNADCTDFAPSIIRIDDIFWVSQQSDRLGQTRLYLEPYAGQSQAESAALQVIAFNQAAPYSKSWRRSDAPSDGPNAALLRRSVSVTLRIPLPLIEYRMGWPARCLSGSFIPARVNTPHAGRTNMLSRNGAEFPYRPLPLGLTLNTLFYASITAALWFTASRTRAALRRRRGLCPRCKYNLQGLTPDHATITITCPECGHKLPSRPGSAP